MFSEKLKGISKIYGFDSFESLNEDWLGSYHPKDAINRKKQPPVLNNNCVLVIGKIQDTLPTFISENRDLKINIVHIDTDTYPTAQFTLEQIKPYLIDKAIILFDEIYNFPGWSVGEYKALIEVFKEEEYTFFGFSINNWQAAIQYNKI